MGNKKGFTDNITNISSTPEQPLATALDVTNGTLTTTKIDDTNYLPWNGTITTTGYIFNCNKIEKKNYFVIDNDLKRVRVVSKNVFPKNHLFAVCEPEPIIQDTTAGAEDKYEPVTGFLLAYFKLTRELSNRKLQDLLDIFSVDDVTNMALILLADKHFNKDLFLAKNFADVFNIIVSTYSKANFELEYVVEKYNTLWKENKLTTALFRKMLGVK